MVGLIPFGFRAATSMSASRMIEVASVGLRRSRLSVAHPGAASPRAERMAIDNRAQAKTHAGSLLVRFEGALWSDHKECLAHRRWRNHDRI